jgi:hypothetical protein
MRAVDLNLSAGHGCARGYAVKMGGRSVGPVSHQEGSKCGHGLVVA